MPVDEWRALEKISDQLPIIFARGSRLDSMTGGCSDCRVDFRDDDYRGFLRLHAAGYVVLDAMGFCHVCNKLVRVRFDVFDDLSVVGRKDGRMYLWPGKREGSDGDLRSASDLPKGEGR